MVAKRLYHFDIHLCIMQRFYVFSEQSDSNIVQYKCMYRFLYMLIIGGFLLIKDKGNTF